MEDYIEKEIKRIVKSNSHLPGLLLVEHLSYTKTHELITKIASGLVYF